MITDELAGPVLCAVSGGVDSMYLLCRLRELGWPVMAAHFNHCLRGAESERDEAFVRDFCLQGGIPLRVGRGDVGAYALSHGLGTEEAARALRYAFLERAADELGAGCIATAHTANDNAETMLFNLARGAGLKGLSGIPPLRGRIVRPMLDVTREEAEEYLAERGIFHVEDSSNANDEFARNRIRHAVTPVLRDINPAFVRNSARTASLLRRDEQFLSGLAAEHVAAHGADAAALAALPEPVAARAVRLLAGREQLAAVHIDAILRAARCGGAVDVPGMRVERVGSELVFGAAPRPRLPDRELGLGETLLPEAGLAVRVSPAAECPAVYDAFNTFFFSCAKIYGKIFVTARRDGDSMRPLRRNCGKTLKQLFLEAKIPAQRRGAWPVLRDEAGVIGVYGLGAEERAAARPGDAEILKIQFVLRDAEDM